MNTLPRAVTAQFFPTVDSYNALRRRWSALMKSDRRHTLTAAHHLLYLALLGKDWRKAFTCPTNRRKLENGAFPGWMMFRAADRLHSTGRAGRAGMEQARAELLAPFDGLVTPEMLQAVCGHLPRINSYAFRPTDFAQGAFLFEAYTNSESAAVPPAGGTIHA